MTIYQLIYQALINDVFFIPIAFLVDTLMLFFVTKYIFHLDLMKMILGDKTKKGMYITLENYTEGYSGGAIVLSVDELVNAGGLPLLEMENVRLRTEIERLKKVRTI